MAGGSAWTARHQDFGQYLIFDLGDVRNVTGIATQGRHAPLEYVVEYGIGYGSNGLDYADYREIDGSTKVAATPSAQPPPPPPPPPPRLFVTTSLARTQ